MWLQILSLLLTLAVSRVLWRRWRYDLHRVPSPPGLPLLGHTLEFLYGQPTHQACQWMGGCLQKLGYPKLMRIDVAGSPMLVVTDVSFVKEVMMSKTASFPKHNLVGGNILLMVGNDPTAKSTMASLLPSPYVKAIRRVYTNAFQTKNLKTALPKLEHVIGKLINIIEADRAKGPVEFQPLFIRMMLDVVGAFAFDANLGGLDGSREIYTLALEAGVVLRIRSTNPLKRTYHRLFPKSAEAQRQNNIIDKLTSEWNKLTKEILERADPPEGEELAWFALKNLTDPETEKPIPYNSLVAEVGTLALTGTMSIGHTMGWLLALLASYPVIVDKLLETLREKGLYGPGARDVTFEDLGELSYLTAIIKEGIRIADVISFPFPRSVPKDMTILGYCIPKDTIILAPGSRAVLSEEIWGDPHVFRPERWLTGEDMSQKYTLGFSVGPRDCVGQKLAMLEMRLVIIKLLTRYEFSTTVSLEEMFETAKDGPMMEARDGIRLNVKPRTVI